MTTSLDRCGCGAAVSPPTVLCWTCAGERRTLPNAKPAEPLIQTQTPGGQTPPTLAELRKLAKRKGMKVDSYRYGGCNEQLNVFILGRNNKSEVPNIRAVVFAALSALPDKERAR